MRRSLLNSVLVANEVVHIIKNKKKRCMIIKIYFKKAYYTIKWNFILYMLKMLGFCKNGINWITNCLIPTMISILVNESSIDEIKHSKGIR